MEEVKKKPTYRLAIWYVALLTLLPFGFVLASKLVEWFVSTPLFAGKEASELASISSTLLVGSMVIYIVVLFVLGILNITTAFRKSKEHDEEYCVKAMLILKYGLVVHFIIAFVFWVILVWTSTLGLTLLFPQIGFITLPLFMMMVPMTMIMIWLEMLPSSAYGVMTVRFTGEKEKWTFWKGLPHGILQFIYVLDILDAMYLSVKYWGQGKKSAIVIGAIYLICVILVIYALVQIWLQLQTI